MTIETLLLFGIRTIGIYLLFGVCYLVLPLPNQTFVPILCTILIKLIVNVIRGLDPVLGLQFVDLA
jgi:hypothetical protein